LSALSYEYPQLYKDPKVMGMGGANVAVGGDATSVFYNPAGLSYIPKEYGTEVDLINLNISINDNILDFIDDMDDATSNPPTVTGDSDTDESLATLDVVDSYTGKNMHVDASATLLNVSRKGEKIGFGIVPFGGMTMDFRTHRPLHKVLEVQGLIYTGFALGMSYDFSDVTIANKYELNKFALGVGIKKVDYASIKHEFSLAELIEHDDDMDEYITDDLAEEGSSTVLDLGLIYRLDNIAPNFQAGFSIMNIGGIGDEDVVYIPQTLNAGVAYLRRWEDKKFFNQVRVAADYIDLTNEYDQDKDWQKRLRLGVETNVWDGWLSTFALRAGLYQGAPSYGLNLRLTVLEVGYAVYEEEVGAYAGQDRDKRQMLNLKLNIW
jgi:hypothetical protein